MIAPVCAHARTKKFGHGRKGNLRIRCLNCGKAWTIRPTKVLGEMRIPVESAKLVLRLLTDGMSIRGTERTTGIDRNTVMKLMVPYGDARRTFLNRRMRNLTLTQLQFEDQWTYMLARSKRA